MCPSCRRFRGETQPNAIGLRSSRFGSFESPTPGSQASLSLQGRRQRAVNARAAECIGSSEVGVAAPERKTELHTPRDVSPKLLGGDACAQSRARSPGSDHQVSAVDVQCGTGDVGGIGGYR